MIIAAIAVACKKDKEEPAAVAALMLKWNRVYGASGINNAYESYTFDADNKVSASVYYNSEISATPGNYTYTRNAAGQIIKSQRGNGYTAYEYNSSGQLSKSSLYNASGTLTGYYLFSYATGGYGRAFYSAAGVAGSRLECTYTADKRNIAKEVWYNSRGDVMQQIEYTYLAGPKPESIYPFSEIYMLDRGFVSKNAIDVITVNTPGYSPAATTYTYTYNPGGYPLTQKETFSNTDAPSVTTYEYIVR